MFLGSKSSNLLIIENFRQPACPGFTCTKDDTEDDTEDDDGEDDGDGGDDDDGLMMTDAHR